MSTPELENVDEALDAKIKSQDVRDRIIDVVCDSQDIVKIIDSRIDKKIKEYDKDVKIEAYQRYFSSWKFWLPTIFLALSVIY